MPSFLTYRYRARQKFQNILIILEIIETVIEIRTIFEIEIMYKDFA